MEESPHRFIRSNVTIDELRSKQESKQRRRTAFYVLLFLVVVIAFLTVGFFRFFRVAEINITGFCSYTEGQIREQIAIEEGDNLFSFDPEEIEETLRKALPFLGDVSVTRKWPSTVNVEVAERQVDLTMRVGEDAYLLSGDLHVLGKIGGGEIVPGVTSLTAGAVVRCLVGETVTFRENRMGKDFLELFDRIKYYNMKDKIVSIDMTSRFDIYLNYENRFTIYLADVDNADLKLRFLAEILSRLNATDRGTIDLSDPREAAVRLDDSPVVPVEDPTASEEPETSEEQSSSEENG